MADHTRTAAVLPGDTVIELASIDDYLGSSGSRFFGSGYRRSTYDIHRADPETGLTATVDVSYPTDWSSKGADSDLRPHLSTVDAMVLGIRSAEGLLSGSVGLTQDQVLAARLQKLTVRAGTRPEESLTGLPMRTELKKTVPAPDGEDDQADSTVTATVGVMHVSMVLRHDAPPDTTAVGIDYAFLQEDPVRHWGSGYRHDEQDIRSVTADTNSLLARASVGLSHGQTCGTRASHAPGPATCIDAFVSLLQLGQILIYELDDLDRAHSDTLWMQQLTLRPAPATLGPGPATPTDAQLHISDHQLLELPTGVWRNLELRGETGGITMSATFAHRIPHLEGGTS